MAAQSPTPAPETIADLADGCVRFVHQALQLPLDYTPDTLPILDHYLRNVPKPHSDELLGLLVPAVGAYFGEVVRRSFGTVRWHCPETEYTSYRLEFEQHFLVFNPMGMAIEALSESDAPGWHAHVAVLDEDREAVRIALEQTDDVQARDYFSLAVRFEVIEQIVAVLAHRAVLRGDTHRHFSRAVYRAAGVDE